MQNRQVPEQNDPEVGHLTVEKAYAYIDALRLTFDVGAFGLGANGTITRPNSLLTVAVVEGVATALSLGIAVHESVNVCCYQCCRRDGRTVATTERPLTQYSLYLTMRMGSIASSAIGVALLAADLAMSADTTKSTVGVILLAIGVFGFRTLTASAHKPAGTVLEEDDEQQDDIEMQRLRSNQPPVPLDDNVVPLVSDDEQMPRSSMRSNQFFQPAPEPAPAPAGPKAERAKRTRVKVYKTRGAGK